MTASKSDIFLNLIDAGRHPTETKIREFKLLQAGWHYGQGVPPQDSTLNKAVELHREAQRHGFFYMEAFPGVSGEVMLVVYHKKHSLEFTLEVDGMVTFIHEIDGRDVAYEEGLSFEQAKAKIKGLRKRECDLSNTFTKSITVHENNASSALPLRILAAAASPPLIEIAF